MLERIRELHEDSRGALGAPRMREDLKAEGKAVGFNRVARLMPKDGLQGWPRRKRRDAARASAGVQVAVIAQLGEGGGDGGPGDVEGVGEGALLLRILEIGEVLEVQLEEVERARAYGAAPSGSSAVSTR